MCWGHRTARHTSPASAPSCMTPSVSFRVRLFHLWMASGGGGLRRRATSAAGSGSGHERVDLIHQALRLRLAALVALEPRQQINFAEVGVHGRHGRQPGPPAEAGRGWLHRHGENLCEEKPCSLSGHEPGASGLERQVAPCGHLGRGNGQWLGGAVPGTPGTPWRDAQAPVRRVAS